MSPAYQGGLRRWWRTSGCQAGTNLLAWLSALLIRELGGRIGDLWTQRADSRRRSRRIRAERRLIEILGELRGPFVKIGQFASLRYDVLSADTREALTSLQEHVPPLAFGDIREIIEYELSSPLESHFQHFDPVAIGSASIGQVHRAHLEDGTAVAVKVQYPWIAASVVSDLRIIRSGLWLFGTFTGRRIPQLQQLFTEFSAGLQEELDFTHEARCAEQIALNLAGDSSILVPQVFHEQSTSRVLTASYHETVPIEREVLERHGIAVRPVLEALTRAYAKMVFVDGLFHADPHPGNLYVVKEPDMATHPRVLFVDFGLSKRLEPQLRDAMRQGLYALLQRDVDAFVGRMHEMGMIEAGATDQVHAAITAMFEQINASTSSHPDPENALGIAGSQVLGLKDQAKLLLEETPGLQLPNDLLLYAKTLSYLFALGDRLAPEVDLLRLALPYLLRFLAESPGSPANRLNDRDEDPGDE